MSPPSAPPPIIGKVPGVYVSYPFCPQKCTYCNFASGVFPRALVEGYLPALAAEIRTHAGRWQPETVSLGGGTPSSLAPAELASFLTFLPGRPCWGAAKETAARPLAVRYVQAPAVPNRRPPPIPFASGEPAVTARVQEV
jgi:hypothetical protein